jgi:hypothetical protein
MKSDIERTCDSVRTSLSASARLVTVGSKAAETTYLRPTGRSCNREVVTMTASIKGGQRVRLDDKSNTSELSKVPSNPAEPKMLTGSRQKAMQSAAPIRDLGHTDTTTAGIETGANSSMLLERNTVNPTSRLIGEAGVIARCAVEVADRGCWIKRRPFCNGADRSCNITPPCKRADFQPVIRDERTRRTFTGGNCK